MPGSPMVPVCPGPREFPVRGRFSDNTRTVPGKPAPSATLPVAPSVCWPCTPIVQGFHRLVSPRGDSNPLPPHCLLIHTPKGQALARRSNSCFPNAWHGPSARGGRLLEQLGRPQKEKEPAQGCPESLQESWEGRPGLAVSRIISMSVPKAEQGQTRRFLQLFLHPSPAQP